MEFFVVDLSRLYVSDDFRVLRKAIDDDEDEDEVYEDGYWCPREFQTSCKG